MPEISSYTYNKLIEQIQKYEAENNQLKNDIYRPPNLGEKFLEPKNNEK